MADRNIDAHVEVPQYVNILAATICSLMVITTDMHEVAGYHFIHIAPWIQTTLDFMLAFAEGTEGVTLMVFNVHRLLLCIRGHLIKIFYVVFIPISLLFVIFYAYVNTFYPDSSLYLCYVFFAFVSSIIVICYFILRRHFKNNGYSENVVNMIFMWYPAAIGTTIMWSISGFLTGPAQKRSKSNISIVDLATVRRCTLEDQLARFKSKY
ncbi:hypothetical protein RB195_009633 [Necator americanus]|uniref:7TM GPCR serpentine receptor class x (Srx) domain-containing protein n=1 Tax=Necator americanus TaxID=51031 RepID=A0ABR1CXJ8_NECAM